MARVSYKDWITKDGLQRIESWARDGLTNEQIAKNMGCNVSTLYAWVEKYPDIKDALKKGKQPIDFEVENTLLKRALGFEYKETRKIAEITPDGERKERVEVIQKYAPPDTSAIIFWLKNRKPEVWRKLSPEYKRKTEAETNKLELEAKEIEQNLQVSEDIESKLTEYMQTLVKVYKDEK